MKTAQRDIAGQTLAQARHSLRRHHLPRIARCLSLLSEEDIWRRAHSASNSVGNLVLHLEGNVRQWILSGLGGAPDRRDRDREFRARGPIPRRQLLARLRRTVFQAASVIKALAPGDLARTYSIQGFRVTGLQALWQVTEHFAYHSGQIIFATKLKLRRDLRFTRLPGERWKPGSARSLPAL